VSDIFTPLSGEVAAVNEEAIQHPEVVNRQPYGQGWLFRLALNRPSEWDQLLTAEAYRKLVNGPKG
jgi:glycine cleavage system H protein